MGVYTEAVQKLYVAYFSRPADAAGLTYWEGVVAKMGGSTTAVSAAFAASDEYKETFAGQSEYQIINTIYLNLFGRTAEPAALQFWGQGLINGAFTIDNAVTAIAAGAQNADLVAYNNKVAYATAFTAALDTTPEILYYSGEEANTVARGVMSGITTAASLTAAIAPAALQASIDAVVIAGTPAPEVTNHTLVAAAEILTGSAGNDNFIGSNTTVALDQINGGAGVDTLTYNDAAGGTSLSTVGLSLTSIENINVRSVGAVSANTTSFSGVTAFNVQAGTTATVTSAATTDVSVSGVSDAIIVQGGKNIAVTDAVAGKAITIGTTTGAAGTVTVTDSNVGDAVVAVEGGTAVTLNLTNLVGATAAATVGNGGAAADMATGAVVVNSTNAAVAGTDATLGNITVKGGSTITVNQTAASALAAADVTGATVTQGNVAITGGNGTTAVTVNQTAAADEVTARAAVAAVAETASIKFGALKAGDAVTVAGLTFTAAVDMSAAEVAAAFSNLVSNRAFAAPATIAAGDTQSAGPASKGIYTGLAVGFTSGAATGDTVVFTTTGTGNVADITSSLTNTSGNSVAPIATVADGVSSVSARAGVLGVVAGSVTIDDAATAAITTVTVNGYAGASTIGATNTLSKLANLTLANSGTGTMAVDAAAITSLNLSVNAIEGAVNLDASGAASIKSLNLTATGADSAFAVTAAAAETLAVSGDMAADLTGSTLSALKTVTVSGSAGLTLDAGAADTITSVTTTGTTGRVAATIEGARATYTGGAGSDVVTLVTDTAITKAINLGAGDDTLVFGTLAVTGTTAAIAGGEGTDTLSMAAATADGLDGSTAFSTQLSGFERLSLGAAGTTAAILDTVTVNLANLGFTNYVRTAGTGDTGTDVLVLDKLASNATVVLTAQGLVTANVTDAATATADVVNVVLSTSAATLNAGTFTAANVETINVTATDTNTSTTTGNGVDTENVTITAGAATTVNVTGNAHLNLTLTGSTKVTTIDASAATGRVVVAAVNTTAATTIKGGTTHDVLTTSTGNFADVVTAGAGNDVLVGNGGLASLTGGAGNDIFVFGTASTNSNSYNTVTDFAAGDLIQFTGASNFEAAKISLGETAVFQDFANAAINSVDAGEVAWFQFGGNTYLVMDAGAEGTSFVNGQDIIVKLTGTIDLTNASFNNTEDTIAL